MDLRHMRHFVAVAEELHFGRAARRLNMAQPPVSQSIRRLEDDLGVILFNRSRRGVELTDAGHVFLAEARRTLLQAELARKMTRRAVTSNAEVRLSFVGAALNGFLPPVIVQFRQQYPDIVLTLREDVSPEQVKGLLAGDADIAFILGEAEDSDQFERFLVQRSQFVAAVPANWALAERDTITLQELSVQPFIRPPERFMRRIPQSLAIFQSVGALPHVVQEATQTSVIMALVGAGLGCSVVTSTASGKPPPGVKLLQISDHPRNRRWEMVMIWNADHLTASGAAFVELVKDRVAANPDLLIMA